MEENVNDMYLQVTTKEKYLANTLTSNAVICSSSCLQPFSSADADPDVSLLYHSYIIPTVTNCQGSIIAGFYDFN